MNIAIVGAGRIGGLLGSLWAKAGHTVLLSSRHPESLASLVQAAGPNATAGTVEQALAHSELIFLSIPYHGVKAFGEDYGHVLKGKIVLETGNPYPNRDGAIAEQVLASKEGTGIWSARWLPGLRLVRAFNSVWDQTLAKEAHRPPPQVGIPLASDDEQAMQIAAALVRDAGFDPVPVGPLASAARFDVGTPVYNTGMSGPDLRQALNC